MTVFVDREDEITEILKYINAKVDVFIYGLRGIGKTSLLERVKDILVQENRDVLFIDGYSILSPNDICAIIGKPRIYDARESIKMLLELDNQIIIIDEFTAFIQSLSKFTPFSNINDVVRFFRNLIQTRRNRGGESVILSSSALGFVKRLTMQYFSPLFREFKLMFIGPMSLDAIAEMASKMGLNKKKALELAYYSSGNPFYAKKILEYMIAHDVSPLDAVFELISSRGDLDIYFSALIESLSIEERFILHLVARGKNRFYEIENRLFKDPYPFFKRLEENGLLVKIKKGKKHSEYIITDKVFQAWLLHQEIPSLGKMSKETIIVSSLGFEAILRETLRAVTSEIEIKDWLGQDLKLKPFKAVFNYKGKDYEIDALAIVNEEAYIFEAHFWGKAKFDKVLQLISNSRKASEDLGKKVVEKVLVSYFGFDLSEDEIKKARNESIKLLSARELRAIQKNLKINLGF